MAMQKKIWMTTFLFKEFLRFFKMSFFDVIFLANNHLLILDVHESHITLQAIK